jgi:hypothetical protein
VIPPLADGDAAKLPLLGTRELLNDMTMELLKCTTVELLGNIEVDGTLIDMEKDVESGTEDEVGGVWL